MNLLGGMSPTRYWVGVATKDQVALCVAGGYCQIGLGKEGPMKKMAVGDWIVLYSPRAVQDGPNDFLQEFSAIGEVTGEAPYSVQVSPEFAPFRRDVRYEECKSASVLPMVPALSFIRDKKLWGVPFRAGHFDMPRGDFMLIARALLGRIPG